MSDLQRAHRCVPDIEAHPLPRLLQAGVRGALSSDDPGMFGTELIREYRIAAEVFGLLPAELAYLASDAVHASYCPDPAARLDARRH